MYSIILKIILVISYLFLIGCVNNTPKQNDPNYVIIPQSDSSAPEVGMTINDNNTINVNVSDKCGEPPLVKCLPPLDTKSGVLSVIAGATDSDGGIKSVKLWASVTRSRPGQTAGPGLIGGPVQQIDSNAKIGELTKKNLFFLYNFDLIKELGSWDNLTLVIWTEAENFHGGKVETLSTTIKYSR